MTLRIFVTFLALTVWPTVVLAERVALLIGNGQYDASNLSLKNPPNDVAAMSNRLTSLGFVVITAINAPQSDMARALAAFESRLKGAELGLFFYAGHGTQAHGENYLLSTDFADRSQTDLNSTALTLSQIRAAFARAAPKAGIIILDACRDNPLALTPNTNAKGLARSNTGPGLLIAYATDPGNVAFEGDGETSVFTTALLKHIAEPGLDVRLMFGRVRQDVVLKSRGAQVPWVEESLIGAHTLNPSLDNGGREALIASDIAAWRKASSKSTPAPYRNYLAAFPNGMFKDFAAQRIARLTQTQTAAPADAAPLDVTQDPSRISAALSILGFAKRSLSPLDLDDLETAALSYRASLGADASFNADNLFADASRLLLYLGGNVGRQIQTDIAALASVDQTLIIANDAMAELIELAESDPNAKPYVDQAREDIAAIRQAQTEILAALDQERAYYEDLMQQANTNFADYMQERTIGVATTRSAPTQDPKLTTRARLFLKHVQQEAIPETRGSYRWLADFLPKS